MHKGYEFIACRGVRRIQGRGGDAAVGSREGIAGMAQAGVHPPVRIDQARLGSRNTAGDTGLRDRSGKGKIPAQQHASRAAAHHGTCIRRCTPERPGGLPEAAVQRTLRNGIIVPVISAVTIRVRVGRIGIIPVDDIVAGVETIFFEVAVPVPA